MANNPYKNLPKNKAEEQQQQLQEKIAAQAHGHYTDEHIEEVTQDFCQWVANLGGDKDNIEEETVGDIFAIGHEAKPQLAVPLHVIQIIDVPRDLTPEARAEREIAAAQATKEKTKKGKRGRKNKKADSLAFEKNVKNKEHKKTIQEEILQELAETKSNPNMMERAERMAKIPLSLQMTEKKPWICAGTNKSQTTKSNYRFGAWYLDPKTWKKLKPDEKLECPKSTQFLSTTKKKSLKFDEEIATMHVTKEFMDYVHKSGKRKPEFFSNLEIIQARFDKEEKARELELEKHKAKLRSKMYKAPSPTPKLNN